MAKGEPRVARLKAKIAADSMRPVAGFGLGDLVVAAGGGHEPAAFPAGDWAPASLPFNAVRREIVDKLAGSYAEMDHATLARIAATIHEGSMAWRAVFAAYVADTKVMHADMAEQKDSILWRGFEAASALENLRREVALVLADPATRAHLNALAGVAARPAATASCEAKALWQERRAGKHPNLRTNEQFAIECIRRWPVLKHGTILKWCAAWEKEARQSASAS